MKIWYNYEEPKAPDNRVQLRSGKGKSFWSVKGDDGKQSYDLIGNADNEEILRDIFNYAIGDPAAMDTKYKYGNWTDSERED